MATTVSTTDYDGNGSTTAYSFTFPYLKTEDVKVALNGKTLATTEYTFATATSIQLSSISGSLNTFQTNTQNSSGAPLNGVKVLIYRDTDVAAAKAVFASGSSFRATDLNNNKEQSLYTEQELKDPSNPNNEPNTINGTGNPGQGVGFEGNLYFDTTNNLLFGPKENGAWGTGTPISATSTESIQDIVGAMFSGNTETNITATYQDSDGTIDLVSDNTVYTHPNHSGEVTSTGDGATVIASNVVDEDNLKISNSPSNGTFLQYKDGTDELTWAAPTDTNTQLSTEQVQDIAGAMFSSNTENGVTVTYQDADGTIDLEATELYHSGTKKAEATSTGIKVSGSLAEIINTANAGNASLKIKAGEGGSAYIDFVADEGDGASDNFRIIVPDEGPFKIQQYGGGNWVDSLSITSITGVSLFENGTKRFETTSTGATVTGKLIVTGDLQIDGTTTTVNSTTMTVDDKNIVLGSGAANDAAADGGGITLESGQGNKTWNWVDSTDAWTSSEHIHVGDSKKLLVGTGSDLQIYHNSSHSFIERVSGGTGNLYIRSYDSGSVAIETGNGSSGSENAIVCNGNSSVDLYHSGSGPKLSTTASGARVYGQLTIESDLNFMGDSDSTRYIDARLGDSNALTLRGTTGGDVSPWETLAEFYRGGGTKFYYDGGGTPTLEVTSTGARVYGQLTVEDQLNFMGGSDTTRYIDARVGDGNALTIRGTTGGDASHETLAEFFRGGSSGVKLYHNNSAKLETTSAGVTVTGTLTGDVAFTQTGTGAVARTVDAKLKDNINVWDFIPVGTTTASTDCASYFQAAINTGKTVYVPKGTYRIDSTLVLDGNYESLIGDECLPVLLKWTEGPAIQISEPGGTGLNEFSRVENFYIQRKIGGSFTCPNYNATLTESLAGVVVSGHGATVNAAVQMTRISNLRVGNFAIGFFFADCVGVTVHKCFTQNLALYTNASSTADGTTITSSMWGVGFYFDATRYGAGAISPLASIEIVETDDNRDGDPTTIKSVSYLIVGEDPRDIFFQRAESTKADYGWYIDGLSNDDLNWDLHIIRPIVDQFKKHGIYAANLDGVGSLSVTGGYFVGSADAEATIYAINSNGINVTGGTQLLGLTNDTGNNTDDGIRLDSCSSCSIIGNRFANLQYAISLNGTTYSTIQGNVISAAASEDDTSPTLHAAIRLFGNSTFNTVGNNTIRGQSASVKYGKGIELASGSDNCKLVGNIVDSTTVTTGVDDSASGTEYNRKTTEEIQDIVGAMFSGNTETNITATYQDGDGTIDLVASAGGGATGTDYDDDAKIRLGTGNDLEIYHDGSHSYIKDAGTGTLRIEASEAGILSADGSETMAQFVQNGAVSLRYDNSTKLEVTSSGARVYGQLTVEDQLNFMGGSDTTRYIDARTGDGNALTLRGTTGGDASHETLTEFFRGGAAKLYYDGSKKFETTADGAKIETATATLFLQSTTDGNAPVITLTSDSSSAQKGSISYSASNSGYVSGYNEAFRISGTESNIAFDVQGAISIPDSGTKDAKLLIGTGNDLEIYHDGSNSVILDNGTGNLKLYSNGAGVDIHKTNGENIAKFISDGAVELYYDNSKKFETHSNGVTVTGRISVSGNSGVGLIHGDSVKAVFGDSDDLQIYHDATNSYIKNTTGDLRLLGSVIKLNNAANTETCLKTTENGGVELYYDNSNKLSTTNSGARVYGQLTVEDHLNFMGGSDTTRYIDARLGDGNALTIRGTTGGDVSPWETLAEFTRGGAVNLYYDTSKKFATYQYGIDVTGNVKMSGHAYWEDNGEAIFGDGSDLKIYHNGTHSYLENATGKIIFRSNGYSFKNAASSETHASFDNDGAVNLYYDNSKKFSTNSNGCSTHGNHYFDDNQKVLLGSGSDMEIYHNGTDSIIDNSTGNLKIIAANDTVALRVFTDGTVNIGDGADNVQLRLGAGSDLKLYHDGSHSYIQNAAGDLRMACNSVGFTNHDKNEWILNGNANAEAKLYYDNSSKLSTTSSGARVYGQLTVEDELNFMGGSDSNRYIDARLGSNALTLRGTTGGDSSHEALAEFYRNGGVKLYFDGTKKFETTSTGVLLNDDTKVLLGNSADMEIFHNGTDSVIYNATGNLDLRANNIELQKSDTSERHLMCNGDAGIELYYDNSLKCQTTAWGFELFGNIHGDDGIQMNLGTSNDLQIYHNGTDSVIGNGTGTLQILSPSEMRFRASSFQFISYGNDETMATFIDDGAVSLYYDNVKKFETTSGGAKVTGQFYCTSEVNLTGQGNKYIDTAHKDHYLYFRRINDGDTGHSNHCTVNSAGVWSADFNDTSDEKLKENITAISDGAISKVKQLRPVNFDWKETDKANNVSGFIAQEVKTVLPNLVYGTEYDPTIIDDSQGIKSAGYSVNTIGIVAHLTKALQEAIAKIETLETKVAALESS